MPLTFRVADGVWNPESDAVQFFGGDDGKVVVFSISRQVLTELEAGSPPGNPLVAYNKHLLRIRDVARKAYGSAPPSGPGDIYELTSDHFR